MNLRKELLLSVSAALVLSGSSGMVMSAERPAGSSDYTVTIQLAEGGKPGVPILVRVRSRDGRLVVETKTDSSGTARFRLAPEEASSGPSLEALLDLGAGRSVGVIETLNPECKAYGLFLPKFEVMQCHGAIVRSP